MRLIKEWRTETWFVDSVTKDPALEIRNPATYSLVASGIQVAGPENVDAASAAFQPSSPRGKKSAQLVTGGGRTECVQGFHIEPIIFLDLAQDASIYCQEIFGPVLTLETFKTEDEVVALANDTEYGLSGCVYTSNVSRALRVASRLESGTIGVNSGVLPSVSTAFSGYKRSGNGGRENGKYVLREYLEIKAIHITLN